MTHRRMNMGVEYVASINHTEKIDLHHTPPESGKKVFHSGFEKQRVHSRSYLREASAVNHSKCKERHLVQ